MENEFVFHFCLELFLVLVIYVVVMYVAWYVTEWKRSIPQWLDFKPFNCRICLTFWTLTTIFLSSMYLEHLRFGIMGMILTVLNAIAMKWDEYNRIEKGKELYNDLNK